VPSPLNKTESRVSALTEVKAGLVSYDPTVGEYTVTDGDHETEQAGGARRRTYAELRTQALIAPRDPQAVSIVDLTEEGQELASTWSVD
jgi:hypothetical protein